MDETSPDYSSPINYTIFSQESSLPMNLGHTKLASTIGRFALTVPIRRMKFSEHSQHTNYLAAKTIYPEWTSQSSQAALKFCYYTMSLCLIRISSMHFIT